MTTTYRTAGTTDDVTTCDLCGREELAAVVILQLVDENDVVQGEVFAGTTCAAQAAGRSASVIGREARDADRAAQQAASDAAFRAAYDAEQEVLDALGLERTFPNVKRVRAILAAA